MSQNIQRISKIDIEKLRNMFMARITEKRAGEEESRKKTLKERARRIKAEVDDIKNHLQKKLEKAIRNTALPNLSSIKLLKTDCHVRHNSFESKYRERLKDSSPHYADLTTLC